jgi:nucleoside-triphosphatase THEP1
MLPFISSYLLYTICVTGGPQSGKTTALATIRDFLVEKGFQVFILPSVKELNMNVPYSPIESTKSV